MSTITHLFKFLLPAVILSTGVSAGSSAQIILYTPYTSISVPPGETIDYTIDVKNEGTSMQALNLYMSGLPQGWNATLKAGGYAIRQISVLPGEKKSVSLQVEVPMQVNRGNHSFRLVAGDQSLAMVVYVSEKGTFKTEFTSDQANMQGHAETNFNFSTKLTNRTGEKQMYSLRANPPRGWQVAFKPNYKQATAVEVDPGQTQTIPVEITPPNMVEAGTYQIPVQAANSTTSAELTLEVVVTGSYKLEVTTPSGLLSTRTTAGKDKRIEMMVRNTGTAELKNVIFQSSKPKNWEVDFSPDTVSHLAAGENAQVTATITADDRAIPGDYVTRITARTPETSSEASLRISVKTPLLWGWVGILIILATIALIFYLFRKYGRR
jgi:uncharacterized membrane protein